MPDGIHNRILDYPLSQGFGSQGTAPPPPDDMSKMTTIEIDDDGGVTIKAPAVHTREKPTPATFNDNLAIGQDNNLSDLAHELLEGIDSDIQSRKGWIDNYTNGLDLLGLTIDDAKDSKRGPASRIGHPLLLGAVVKGQSAAAAELMPSGGPCKVATRDGDDVQADDLAQALERDMNWYLTTGAPEYYPDFDRGLFGLMFSGNLFKKIYEHPLRRRPVSETIAVDDLIVSEDATDLETALRVTHRAEMSRPGVKRMQWMKVWRDVELSQPMPSQDQSQRKKDEITGVRPISMRPNDTPFCIYEPTSDLVLADYGLDDPHAPGDLPVSYAVTLEKDSRQILDIRRQWKFGDEEFQRRQRFVHYGMNPALGFLCLGHLHLLGNQTKALRAIWRILVTAGMYANAPSGVKAKSVRTMTNEINPQPGEWPDVDIGPFDDIRKAFMALPYKDASAVFIQFSDLINKESMQLATSADVPVGDSRTDIPVGTMLAMIEQATQIASAVHKRFYRTQARELQLLKECFAENPEALWKLNRNPARQWREAAEFADIDLVPKSDPNVPSQMHRIMLSTAMIQLAEKNPDIYDRVEVHDRAWKNVGVNDAQTFLHQPTPQPGPPGAAPTDPALGQAKLMEAGAKIAKAQTDAQDTQRKAATEAIDTQQRGQTLAVDAQSKAEQLASQERIEGERLAVERERLAVEEARAHRQMGLEHERAGAELDLKREVAAKPVPRPAAKGKK